MLADRLICRQRQSITSNSLSLGAIHSTLDTKESLSENVKRGRITGFLGGDAVGIQWRSSEMMHFSCALHRHGGAFRKKWIRPTMEPCGAARAMFAEEEKEEVLSEANKGVLGGYEPMNSSGSCLLMDITLKRGGPEGKTGL